MKLHFIFIVFIAFIFSGCIPGIEPVKPLALKKIKIETIEIKKIKKTQSMNKILDIFFEDKTPIGFLSDKKTIWFLPSFYLILPRNTQYIIKPIKEKNLYILFLDPDYNAKYKVIYINNDTKTYKVLPGYLSTLQDLDNDNLPEVITASQKNNKIITRAFTIKNINTNPVLSLLSQKIASNKNSFDNYLLKGKYSSFYYPLVKYDVKKNYFYYSGRRYYHRKLDYDKDYISKIMQEYFSQWDTGKISFKHTKLGDKTYYTSNGYQTNSYTFNPDNFSKKTLKILINNGLNPKGKCLHEYAIDHELNLEEVFLFDTESTLSKIMICSQGKGYTKLPDGRLIIFDWTQDGSFQNTNVVFQKVQNNRIAFISSPDKYFIIANFETEEVQLNLWKDFLGYTPSAIIYFDKNTLIATDQNNFIHIYKLLFKKSTVVRETW